MGEWLERFERVSKRRPCPVCNHAEWCAVARDGTVAVCQRVESGTRWKEAGWVHRLSEPLPPLPIRTTAPVSVTGDWNALQRRLTLGVDLEDTANRLNVGALALERLGCGWSREYSGNTFPMRDARGSIIGIRVRKPDGPKFCYPGSHNGLFYPPDNTGDLLFVCEGPTDCAAILSLSLAAVGRPHNTGGHDMLLKYIARIRPKQVVIVADRDTGAAEALTDGAARRLARAVRRSAKIIKPPFAKDVRQWLAGRVDRRAVLDAVECAAWA